MTCYFLGLCVLSLFKSQVIDYVKALLHFFQSGFFWRSEQPLDSELGSGEHPLLSGYCYTTSSHFLYYEGVHLALEKNKSDLVILGLAQG